MCLFFLQCTTVLFNANNTSSAILPKPKNTVRMEDDSHEDKPKSTMAFKLLSRDTKGRIEARQLLVPQSNPMAQKVMKAEEEMRLEKQRLKERTLQINQLIADEEVKFACMPYLHLIFE